MLTARKKLVISLLLLVAACFVFRHYSRLAEGPVYKGRTLERWLRIQNDAEDNSPAAIEAKAAINTIGTNAIPYALRWIQEEYAPSDENDLTHPEMGIGIFYQLGPAASNAIPELARIAVAGEGSSYALNSLVGIGPLALSPVFGVITNTNGNADFRRGAIHMLGNLRTNLSLAFPTLVSCLDDPNKEIVFAAADLLVFDLKPKDKTFLPVLIKMLEHPEIALRLRAIKGISDFGKEGLPAMPALAKRLDDEDPTVRSRAARLLHNMAPDVYTNSPSKKLRTSASLR